MTFFLMLFLPAYVLFAFAVSESLVLFLSFFVSYLTLLGLSLSVERKIRFSYAGVSIVIFSLLFFLVAPLIQLQALSPRLVNTDAFDVHRAVAVNVMYAIFIGTYALTYFLITHNKPFSLSVSVTKALALEEARRWRYGSASMFFASTLAILLAFACIIALYSDWVSNKSLAVQLVLIKFISLLPLYFFSYSQVRFRVEGRWYFFLLAVLFFVLILSLKNHYFERRNALGPVYVAILSFVFFNLFWRRWLYLSFSFFVMIVAFPASSILTHQYGILQNKLNLAETLVLAKDQLVGHYSDLHYDAWANGVSMLKMLSETGYSYGQQLLGTFFFFVPRQLWQDKPIATGEMLGRYLMSNAQLWFSNISFALPYEGYADFGYFGVILFAVVLALMVAWLERSLLKDFSYLVFYSYFCFYLYFLLRGSLLAAFSYGIGAFLAIVVFPGLFRRFSRRGALRWKVSRQLV